MTTVEQPVDIGTFIVRTPGTCGGRARIADTRISVKNIAIWYKQGETPEQIVENYNNYITLAQVYAALAYYYANQAQIEAEIADDDAAEAEYMAQRANAKDNMQG